jgi:integrase
MREACARAGIVPPVGFHVLRHTHGSLLAIRVVPMAVIARQLGPIVLQLGLLGDAIFRA